MAIGVHIQLWMTLCNPRTAASQDLLSMEFSSIYKNKTNIYKELSAVSHDWFILSLLLISLLLLLFSLFIQ